MIAITYIGKNSGFSTRVGKATYEFEWQKSLPVGRGRDEIHPDHAQKMGRWKDRRGKKLFFIE